MTHKRYEVMTIIYNNIIVPFIVKAVQKNVLCSFFLSMIITWVFLVFWFASLNMKFFFPQNSDFTAPRVSNEGVFRGIG